MRCAKGNDLDTFGSQRVVKDDASFGFLQANETFEWQFIRFRVFIVDRKMKRIQLRLETGLKKNV